MECQECREFCDDYRSNSPLCHFNGDLSCGGCECHDGFVGKDCKCDVRDLTGGVKDFNDECRAPWSAQRELCSAHGSCICGNCDCQPGYHGKYCHCLKDKCPEIDGNTCSGNGICACSNDIQDPDPICVCQPGFEGNKCQCPTGQERCQNPLTGEVCSGKGSCFCGKCYCHSNYDGKYCQFNYYDTTCDKLESCVKSELFHRNITQSLSEEWRLECDSRINKTLYFDNIQLACQLSRNNSLDTLEIITGEVKDCSAIYDAYFNPREIDDVPSRGDQGLNNDPVRARKLSVEDMKQCTFYYQGCDVTFFHNRIESDDVYDKKVIFLLLINVFLNNTTL